MPRFFVAASNIFGGVAYMDGKDAEHLKVPQENLYRALLISNLIAIYQKHFIGSLSAFCGAVTAAAGCGAAITWLHGGTCENICDTIANTVANVGGMVCDGAKASCAAKIASAVEAGILGMEMFRQGSQFVGGDGIVTKGVENTIRNVGRLAKQGMAGTDKEIIDIMISC